MMDGTDENGKVWKMGYCQNPDILFYGPNNKLVLTIHTEPASIEIAAGVSADEAASEFLKTLRDVFGVDLSTKLPTGA